jgi:hypothetical protein
MPCGTKTCTGRIRNPSGLRTEVEIAVDVILVMLRGAVFLVQEVDDQSDDAETQAENES